MLQKKNIYVHISALAILLAGFLLCRYLFFDMHGMKQWPILLFLFTSIILIISFLKKANYFPLLISFGYLIAFAAGAIFQSDGIDAGGAKTDNFWIIWAAVLIVIMILAAICEKVIMGRKNGDQKINRK